MKEDKMYHQGHRERLRKKFLTRPAESFLAHEVMEMLLFYSIPYRDTNIIAHRVIERFGTLGDALKAKAKDLCDLPGVGEQTAAYFALLREAEHRAAEFEVPKNECFEQYRNLGEYVTRLSRKSDSDYICLITLNNRFEIISTSEIFEGRCTSPRFTARLVAEPALHSCASMAVLVTCRSKGSLRPDEYEIEATRTLADEMTLVGVKLLEHFIVSDEHYIGVSTLIPGGLENSNRCEEFYRTASLSTKKGGKNNG